MATELTRPSEARLLRDIARALSRSLQERLNVHNVAIGHWYFLKVLWDEDGLNQRTLADRVGITPATAVTALRAMEELGYITRRNINGNKKSIHVFLTRKGRALEDRLNPALEQTNSLIVHELSANEAIKFRSQLMKILDVLSEDIKNLTDADRRTASPRRIESRKKKPGKPRRKTGSRTSQRVR